MAFYAIADLHLSLDSNKSMDIFPGWENYTEKITNNFNSLLMPDDTIIIAGDLSWGMNLDQSKKDFELINSFPGKKIFLKGNHDYYWSTKTKMNKFFEDNNFKNFEILHNNSIIVEDYAICGTRGWINDGSEPEDQKIIMRESYRLEASILEAKKMDLPIICFLHYPPVYNNVYCREIFDILVKYDIKECYYGHLHGRSIKKATQGQYKKINFHLISADYLDFMPVRVVL